MKSFSRDNTFDVFPGIFDIGSVAFKTSSQQCRFYNYFEVYFSEII